MGITATKIGSHRSNMRQIESVAAAHSDNCTAHNYTAVLVVFGTRTELDDFHLPLAPKYSVWRSCLYKSHFDNYDCVISSCARVIGPVSFGDHEYTLKSEHVGSELHRHRRGPAR